MTKEMPWIVLKFGGTSVSSRERWETIADVVAERLAEGLRPLVVCSAAQGASNEFEALLAEIPEPTYKRRLEAIQAKYDALAADLGLQGRDLLADSFAQFQRLVRGAELVGEVSPRVHARVMAFGELMSTRLGNEFLRVRGLDSRWQDARELLVSEEDNLNLPQAFLSATCLSDPSEEVLDILGRDSGTVICTQGFIARNAAGDTVLLGRGGSDTSAAYLARMLRARRCEIWTDVPGIYSANPRQIPGARLLMRLNYAEAQEITAMGAEVLHPRCIAPVAQARIPLHIRCTPQPEMAGTVISDAVPDTPNQIKAIVSKTNITLISIETPMMWQRVGFLADVFGCFKEHGISVGLVSTSETNVTVSIEKIAGTFHNQAVAGLVKTLGRFGTVRQFEHCASISLVGANIRSILHRLGGALEVFEDDRVYLVTQAANDLNLSFVVDENEAARQVGRLHHLLFEHHRSDTLLGKTWKEAFADEQEERAPVAVWWRERRQELVEIADRGTPVFVYDVPTLREAVDQLQKLKSVDRILYSIKANSHPAIIDLFDKRGLDFECVSPGEVRHVLEHLPGIDPARILFTPNFAPRHEYEAAFEAGVMVTLDNLYPLEYWPEVFRGRRIFVRVDPGRGRGHHDFVKTAGSQSKFGVWGDQFERFGELAAANDVHIVGLHAHTGSGILMAENWREVASFLASLAEKLPEVEALNLGGGLGVVERPGQIALDLQEVDASLQIVREAHPHLKLWLEPGRFLVAQAGVLLARVTQLKQKDTVSYVGVDAGMNSLIRPALYGSYHRIANLSAEAGREKIVTNIVGPICESGDVLGHERRIAAPREGDVLAIATVGAYGRVMSSNYNLRPPAREELLNGG